MLVVAWAPATRSVTTARTAACSARVSSSYLACRQHETLQHVLTPQQIFIENSQVTDLEPYVLIWQRLPEPVGAGIACPAFGTGDKSQGLAWEMYQIAARMT